MNDLRKNLERKYRGKEILIIGAGGATQGILKPLLDKNPEKILLANRTLKNQLSLQVNF